MLKKITNRVKTKTAVKKNSAKRSKFYSAEEIYQLIQDKAYTLYCKRDKSNGDQTSDWLIAENQVKKELRISK